MGAQLLAKQQPSSASVVSLIFLTYKSDSSPQGFHSSGNAKHTLKCSQSPSTRLQVKEAHPVSPPWCWGEKMLTAFHQLSLDILLPIPYSPYTSISTLWYPHVRWEGKGLTMSFASHGEGFIPLFGTWEHLAFTVLFLACLGDPVPNGTVPPNSRSCHCPIRTYHIRSERSTSIYQYWHLCAWRFPLKVRKTSLFPPKVDQKFQRMNSPYKRPSASEWWEVVYKIPRSLTPELE